MDRVIFERVRSLVERLRPNAICDDCIANKLELSSRQQANRKSRELAGSSEFEQKLGECAICGATKSVIRHKAP
ncbi:hypothetical protein E0504_10405 [Parafrankia sp. BMG5.11]|nr:hypothetical protein E0504_10405 [Parafrankia sp. BMG5.11]